STPGKEIREKPAVVEGREKVRQEDRSGVELGVEDLPLPSGGEVPEGQGLLEVMAGQRDEVLVDHREVGRGPEVQLVLAPGVHELCVRRKGEEQPLTVMVRAGRRTKVDMRGPWRR
ncbi:MAG: hypothetical protein RMJ98_18610, partial [Myxococcales bacterium]|nr:hypothetical protein [Polyangiaceae bacterium]MDW8251312.1 hypothetical protein [Myxococcales bacterium]